MLRKHLVGSLAYLSIGVACLLQVDQPRNWLRIDWFVGAYFVLRVTGSLHSILSSLSAFRSNHLRKEWWALSSDPSGPQWVMLLMALDLVVFFDYGHWQCMPFLIQWPLQAFGLVIYLVVSALQIWTDVYLARFFTCSQAPVVPMNHGPYRFMRHPRYGAAILGKVAMALVFGSIFGWILALAWSLLLLRKIDVEEQHLGEVFGEPYHAYARTTAKVIPGIY
jgi:protein-S-isoprenylcysteine O-methyltransferase Ste14